MFTTSSCLNCGVSWASLADRLSATSFVLGSGGFNLGFEMWTPAKGFVPGVSFAGAWEIGTSSH